MLPQRQKNKSSVSSYDGLNCLLMLHFSPAELAMVSASRASLTPSGYLTELVDLHQRYPQLLNRQTQQRAPISQLALLMISADHRKKQW